MPERALDPMSEWPWCAHVPNQRCTPDCEHGLAGPCRRLEPAEPCSQCGSPLTGEERHYYGHTCERCEQRMMKMSEEDAACALNGADAETQAALAPAGETQPDPYLVALDDVLAEVGWLQIMEWDKIPIATPAWALGAVEARIEALRRRRVAAMEGAPK